MKSLYSTLLIAILLIGNISTTIASPAYPNLIKKEQPDGTIISLFLKGDEKVHWMESEDGYSLLYDNNKTIVYAISDEEGNMIPSSIVAKDASLRSSSEQIFLKGIPKRLNYSATQVNTFISIWDIVKESNDSNSTKFRSSAAAEARGICALINFPDKPLVKTRDEFNNLMNQVGYSASGAKGSVKDYYLENSYGQMDLVITVAGPYTVAKEWAYYGANGSDGNDIPARLQEFAKEAAQLTFTDPNINPADYDYDGDGFINAFHIIYAGYGEEAGGGANCIWAHKYGFPTLTFGNKKINEYSCSPELRGGSGSNITHIGVICHEMCHIFGSPDFYDTDGTGSGGNFPGTGNWDLMASGSWNNSGACPAHINMYQKIAMGWVTPVTLSQPQAISGMANSAKNPVAYRYDTSTSGEYFILENRQQTGFDQYVPGKGLLIYRVSITNSDIRFNIVNTRHPQKVYPVCASANTNPNGTPVSYGSINSGGCPFPGTSNKTSFTDYTVPAATSWNGTNTLKPLTEIREQSGTIAFRFLMPDADPVTNFQATVEEKTTVQLSWNKPSDNVIAYNIYRNNLLVIKLIGKDNTSYAQSNVSSGDHVYCVTAMYNGNKESAPVCKEVKISNPLIDVNAPTVKNLSARNINGDKDIELNWESPIVSDWVTNANEYIDFPVFYPDVNQFTSVVRFTAQDIQYFQGSKLTKVRFRVANTQCKHTIQVWTAPIGYYPNHEELIVNQSVNTPRTGTVDITLDKFVTLTPDRELWIGIKYEFTPNTSVAGTDGGPKIPNRNFVYINNDWYSTHTNDNFNWFISGYMQFDSNFLKAPADDWLRSTTATTATATNYVIYRDNVKIATTNQPRYVDTQPVYGSHIYCVSIAFDDGKESEPACTEAFSSVVTSLTPVFEQEAEINIFPNPVKSGESIEIHCDPQTASTLSIYNITGKLLLQEQVTEPVIHKKMDFEPGVYLLHIKNQSNTTVRKIIIR